MDPMWLAFAGAGVFASFLIAIGLFAGYAERRHYEWLKKNGRI